MSENKVSQEKVTFQDSVDNFRSIMRTGHDANGISMSFQDALALPNFPRVFKRIVTELIVDEVEPILVGARLLDRIQWTHSASANFHTFGALGNEDLDIAEGQEYPEFSLTHGGGQVSANIGKSGLAIKVTEEMIKYSQWDVVAHHIRRGANALARHKERKIFNMLNASGVVVFDNANPAQSEIGRTSGRGLDGAGNGSFTADDMFEMYAYLLAAGFQPDTILCHPLAWATFAKDPVLREHALGNSGLSNWFNTMPSAQLAPTLPQAWKAANRLAGETPFNASPDERVGTQQSTFSLPSYFPGAGMRIIPTPHVPFNSEAKTTSIIMLDSRQTGALIVGEELNMDEWVDKSVDITKIKLRERYGLAVYNQGQGIAIAKNVSIEPNEIVLPPQATVSTLPKITRKG